MLALVAALALAAPPAVPVAAAPAFPNAQQPQAAVDPAGRIYVAFGVGNAIYCTASADGGKTYEKPVKVAEEGELSLGMRRGPRIAATGKAVVIAAVCGAKGKGTDGDVHAWRSEDGGRTWGKPTIINKVDGSAREGLHALATGPDGMLLCAWNDLRNGRMEVYAALSGDHGATWQPDWSVYQNPDGPICPCCQPSAAFDAKGNFHVMWRNDLKGNRDMYVRSFQRTADNRWLPGEPTKLGKGTWHLNACPMDGGFLACTPGGEVDTVWRREQTLYRSRPGQPEAQLGTGVQAWAAPGASGTWAVWVVGRPGALMALAPGTNEPLRLADGASDPCVAAPLSGKGPVVLVWEDGRPGAKRVMAMVLATGK